MLSSSRGFTLKEGTDSGDIGWGGVKADLKGICEVKSNSLVRGSVKKLERMPMMSLSVWLEENSDLDPEDQPYLEEWFLPLKY